MFFNPLFWFLVLVALGIVLLLLLFHRPPEWTLPATSEQDHQQPKRVREKSQWSDPPQNKRQLTQFIQEMAPQVKRLRQSRKSPPKLWRLKVAQAIVRYELFTKDFGSGTAGLDCKLMALYCINTLWKEQREHPTGPVVEVKNYLQRGAIIFHVGQYQKSSGRGRYSGCYEIKFGPWCTHVPKAIVDDLERPGKPSARAALNGWG